MRQMSVNIPESYLRELNKAVHRNFYPNRAEAIRMAIRDLLNLRFENSWIPKTSDKPVLTKAPVLIKTPDGRIIVRK